VDSQQISVEAFDCSPIKFTANVKEITAIEGPLEDFELEGPFYFESIYVKASCSIEILAGWNRLKFPTLQKINVRDSNCSSADETSTVLHDLFMRMPNLKFFCSCISDAQEVQRKLCESLKGYSIVLFGYRIEIERSS
jgi:hypothetical protein